MARKRANNVTGVVDNNPLAVGGTTLNSSALADLPEVVSPDIAVLILDPDEQAGAAEIIHVTAHTAAATSATILRGQEGSVAREHLQNTKWVHGPTEDDWSHGNLDGVTADQHHAQSHAHSTHTSIGADDHHNESHASRHAVGGADESSWGLGIYGDGADGSVTISANTTIGSGGSHEMDKYYDSLTVNSGITLKVRGIRVFVKGTLTNNGTIEANGENGGAGSGTTPGSGGAAWGGGIIPSVTIAGSRGGGLGGGGAQAPIAGDETGHYTAAWNTARTNPGSRPNGGAGGSGGLGAGAAASNAGTYAVKHSPRNPMEAYTTVVPDWGLTPPTSADGWRMVNLCGGGAGGGGNRHSATEGAGGGGGGGGGLLIIFARNLVNAGSIEAKGGNGGAAGGTGDNGGGGGGGGGYIVLVYHTKSGAGTTSVAAGTGGAGTGTGTAGSNGTAGGVTEVVH